LMGNYLGCALHSYCISCLTYIFFMYF
jgi:hypothetical protein